MRLVLRQGEGLTRTRTEISNALQAKLDAEKNGPGERTEEMMILRNFLLSIAFVTGAEALADDLFEKSIQPFLKTYCFSCHGEETQKGKIRLDHLSANMEDRKEAELWARSLEAIEFGEMPSDTADKFPTKAQARLVQDWIARSLAQVGRKVEDKANKEGYGNLIPHDLLFLQPKARRLVDAASACGAFRPRRSPTPCGEPAWYRTLCPRQAAR